MKIILASKSPRRIEILKNLGLDFEIMPSEKEEDMSQKLSIQKLSMSLAKQKADDVFSLTQGDRVIIGSDTMVYVKGKLFGKPKNEQEAKQMLLALSSKYHKVITSLCIKIEREGEFKEYLTYDVTKVKFMKLEEGLIDEYLKDDEYKDKAGAYAVQGKAGVFIEKIQGSLNTVIGLPSHLVYEILNKERII